ncbi:MAG: 6-bladed beta-propeller [Clostridiales bacterium]|nr:6-bladed beta-propeller [Clostridiales bacterium]
MMRKTLGVLAALFMCGGNFQALFSWPDKPPPRWAATEVELEGRPAENPYFFRTAAFIVGGQSLYVLEADDAEVKVYSGSGAFERAFGKKGRGPGEFDMPSDMDVLADRLHVADSGNRRVQVLDKNGRYLSGFSVPFFLWRILALDEDRIVVAHLPSGFEGGEKMLHCFNRRGELLWEALDSFHSGDSVYDALRNFIFLKKGEKGSFFVIPRSGEPAILKMNRDGRIVREIKVGAHYPSKKVTLPMGRKNKELLAFCWNCDWHNGKFYLLIPEYTASKDVGPGNQMAVVDETGQLEAFVDFPLRLSRVAVAGEVVYGLDSEGLLRMFHVHVKE